MEAQEVTPRTAIMLTPTPTLIMIEPMIAGITAKTTIKVLETKAKLTLPQILSISQLNKAKSNTDDQIPPVYVIYSPNIVEST